MENGEALNAKGKAAEIFVQQLANKSFLEDWCYPNPKLADGKELCDLLIIYDEVVIIWQIKALKSDSEGMYKKSAVEKNIRQLLGARRSLFELGKPIKLVNVRRGEEIFNPRTIKETYYISTIFGEEEEVSTFGEIVAGQVIHSFTQEFVDLALRELDTTRDFVDYLKEKTKLVLSKIYITLLGGEKELLAYYLANERNFSRLIDLDHIIIEEGFWDQLQKLPEYLAKKEADRMSYFWDELINRCHTGGSEYESIARELARTNRYDRRVLSKNFYTAHVRAHNEKNTQLIRRTFSLNGVTYCFVFMDDIEPRNRRKMLLSVSCYVARGLHQENKKVIGIATEMKFNPLCSYDYCLFELAELTDDEKKQIDKVKKELGIFLNPEVTHFQEDEYPKH